MSEKYKLSRLNLDDVLERHREALGGAPALHATALHSISSSVTGPQTSEQVDVVDELSRRFRSISKIHAHDEEIITGFDGRFAWEISSVFDGYYPKGHPKSLKAMRALPPLWREAWSLESGPEVPRLLGIGVDSRARECYVIERQQENEAGQRIPIRELLDAETFLIRERREGEVGGELWFFDDYRERDGRRWSFRRTLNDVYGEFLQRVCSVRVLSPEEALFTHPSRKRPQEAASGVHPDLLAFDVIWETVSQVYYDPTFGGVDWHGIGASYRRQVADLDGRGGERFVTLVTRMLTALGTSHFKVIPREHVRTGETRTHQPGWIGLELRWLDGAVVVCGIVPGSPADVSVLQPGFIIKAIDGKDHSTLHHQYADRIGHIAHPDERQIRPYLLQMEVPAGETVRIDYLDGDDRPQSLVLEAVDKEAQHNPHFQAHRRDKVLIIRFKVFAGDIHERFADAIRANTEASSLIIDLRGNPGGIIPSQLSSLLCTTSGSLGRFITHRKTTTIRFDGSSRAFQGRIAIIIDSGSRSSAEVLAGVFQELGRARVFGRRSAGTVLPSQKMLLPNGCSFQYVSGDYVTPKGRRLEGRGVLPDGGEIVLSRQDMLLGRDRDLEAAIEWLEDSG